MAKHTKPPAKPMPKLRGRLRPLGVSLPPELVDQIDAAAAKEFRSRTKMIEIMIRYWLAGNQQQEGDPAAAPQRPNPRTKAATLPAVLRRSA